MQGYKTDHVGEAVDFQTVANLSFGKAGVVLSNAKPFLVEDVKTEVFFGLRQIFLVVERLHEIMLIEPC